MELVAIVISLALLQYSVFGMLVGHGGIKSSLQYKGKGEGKGE